MKRQTAISSMTGFGRARGALSPRLGVSLVVSAVNHRYLDIHIRTNLREDLPEAEAAQYRAQIGDARSEANVISRIERSCTR